MIQKSVVLGGLALVVLGGLVFSFQNCSVRRLTDENALGLSSTSESTDDEVDENGVPNPTSNGTPRPTAGATPGSPAPGATSPPGAAPTAAPTATPAVVCMINSALNGTVVGLTGQPPIRSSYATISRQASMGPYAPAKTSITLSATSVCTSKQSLTAAQGKCPTPSPTPATCTSTKSFSVSITLVCDAASDTATACPNWDSRLNQEITISAEPSAAPVSVIAINTTDSCNSTSGTTTYMGGYYPNTPVGKIKVTRSEGLGDGKIFSVQLVGVELLKGNNTADKITLDGTYAAEIVTIPTCTP